MAVLRRVVFAQQLLAERVADHQAVDGVVHMIVFADVRKIIVVRFKAAERLIAKRSPLDADLDVLCDLVVDILTIGVDPYRLADGKQCVNTGDLADCRIAHGRKAQGTGITGKIQLREAGDIVALRIEKGVEHLHIDGSLSQSKDGRCLPLGGFDGAISAGCQEGEQKGRRQNQRAKTQK